MEQIKYALKEIQAWNPTRKKYATVCYIVSKCYLLEKIQKRNQIGNIGEYYGVVFPYHLKQRIFPEYTKQGKCINKTYVSEVFDTLEQAQEKKDICNQKLLEQKLESLEPQKKTQSMITRLTSQHQEILARGKREEEEIFQNTQDLIVPGAISLESLLEKITGKSPNIFQELAMLLTPEERAFLRQAITNKNCMNCTNPTCRVDANEKVGLDENGNPNAFTCASWENLEMVGRKLVRGYTNSL